MKQSSQRFLAVRTLHLERLSEMSSKFKLLRMSFSLGFEFGFQLANSNSHHYYPHSHPGTLMPCDRQVRKNISPPAKEFFPHPRSTDVAQDLINVFPKSSWFVFIVGFLNSHCGYSLRFLSNVISVAVTYRYTRWLIEHFHQSHLISSIMTRNNEKTSRLMLNMFNYKIVIRS